jgi:GTP-binding protein
VGKSSLLNRLMGQERMVVSDIPGTTRDSIDCLFKREGLTDIIFVDTAGIRKRARVRKRVEKFSVLKAIESIRTSDICICLFDVAEGITEQDRRLAGYTRDYSKGCITVFNKWDLVREDKKLRKVLNQEAKLLRKMLPYTPHINISAATGKNIKRIFPFIDEVYKDYTFKESTGRLNRILKQALFRKNPPVTKGHFLKIYYVTQTGTKPPVLTFFANYPGLFPEHYRRFLENFFRQALNIPNTPIKILLRER